MGVLSKPYGKPAAGRFEAARPAREPWRSPENQQLDALLGPLGPQDSPPADLISMKSFIYALDLIQWELLDVRMDPISLRQGD